MLSCRAAKGSCMRYRAAAVTWFPIALGTASLLVGSVGCRHTGGIKSTHIDSSQSSGRVASPEENKRVVANFVEVCQNGHDLAAADTIFHPDFVDHYAPEGRALARIPGHPGASFQQFYGMVLKAFPDAAVTIDEQIAERDLVTTRKTLRGTHRGEIWGMPPTGKRIELEFIDIFRIREGKLVEHWTHIDLEALRAQLRRKDE
jgi:predicted ester cyclase